MNLEEELEVESRTMSAEKVDEWLPKVHTAIANLKPFCSVPFTEYPRPSCRNTLTGSSIAITGDSGNPASASSPDGPLQSPSGSIEDPVRWK